ncbi:MAG: type II toxin-antitoxin system prevent-host-death family antitoxin [Gammaproteobacteria bacterium]|nr:type II toxin-antitoxin system prevent-host-death family antitoxin [Gammaproteobacteria bacterium]MCY4218091.1 type II toxin-antitoxin system prevent-host-death family antitoxin [Gammaproteobacteria bacterium]MCY4274657.1 type II toxin-antitoxin system prevent-host-death family antitoxin [Gammaproteobacteria bacterium]
MQLIYSTYEAKARFSEILRHVRRGRAVVVSCRGEPVAEIRPVQSPPLTMEERLDEFRQQGIVSASGKSGWRFSPIEHRPTALQRFLDERNE